MENENVTENVQFESVQAKKKPIRAIICAVLVMALYLVIEYAVTIAAMAGYMVSYLGQTGGDANAATQLLAQKAMDADFLSMLQMVATIACLAVILPWYRCGIVKHYSKEQWQRFKERICHVPTALALTFAAMGGYGLATLIAQVIAMVAPGVLESYESIVGSVLGGNAVVVFLAVAILAPIVEELTFRGIIFRILEKNLPAMTVVILQAVLFSVFHMNIMQALYVLPLGLILGYTRDQTRSVLPCIYIHMLNNIVSLIVSAIMGDGVLGLVFAVACIPVSGGVLYHLSQKKGFTGLYRLS